MRLGRTIRKIISYPIEDLGVILYLLMTKVIGVRASSAMGGFLLGKVGPLMKSHKYALANLKLAFPEKTDKEREKIARKMWHNFGRTFGEFPHSRKIQKNYKKYLTIENGPAMESFLKMHGGIFITGHFSGWDAVLGSVFKYGFKLNIFYRASNNPFTNWLIQKIRENKQMPYVPKTATAALKAAEILREDGYLALLVDQHYTKGYDLRFFGQPAKTIPTPGLLATKLNKPFLFATVHRERKMKFRVFLDDPVMPGGNLRTPEAIMQYINDRFEARIREHPEDWFWVHRRWGKGISL